MDYHRFISLFITLISFLTISQRVFCIDFHDFDQYQYRLTEEEVRHKINKYLEKDRAISKYYRLTSEALYLGNLTNEEVDYILYFGSQEARSTKLPSSLKNARIAIDPGHFGGQFAELEKRYIKIPAEKTKDQQSIHFYEGDLTYLTSLRLKELLEDEGALVLITRLGMGQGATQASSGKGSSFRKFQNRADLIARSEKINAFSPDITIVIHYNAHLREDEKINKSLLTKSNYNLAFIPGAFCAGELSHDTDRYEFLRLIVTNTIEQSLRLSEHIVTQFVSQLQVPLIDKEEKTYYTDTSCLIQKTGIYCRNLAMTRRVHSPVCYGETLIQNNFEEVYRLASKNSSIAGIPCSERIMEVAQAYFEGIKSYL
jgi:N-acetylmuramoyl-L-alanine amidase